jgi:hypothetical protein
MDGPRLRPVLPRFAPAAPGRPVVTGLPFALFVLVVLVWAVALLVGTLGSLDSTDESDDEL